MTTLREALKGTRANLDFAAFSSRLSAEDRADFSVFRYGRDFDDKKGPEGADVVSHRYLSGSDYSGGSLVRANQKDAREISEALVIEAHGGYNTVALYFRLDVDAPEGEAESVAEMLAGLENYPAIDDETLSEIEHEEEARDWESYGARDFLKALAVHHGIDADSLEIEPEALSDLFRQADGGSGLVVHEERPGVYFDVGRAAERIPAPFLFLAGTLALDFEGTVEMMESDEGEAFRLLRLLRIGRQLKALANTAHHKGAGEVCRMFDEIRRAKIEAGDTSAPLDRAALDRIGDRSYSLTFERWTGSEIKSLVLTFDPFDHGASVIDGAAALVSFLDWKKDKV